ncbi:pseudouridine synthase [Methylobacterium sp. P31]
MIDTPNDDMPEGPDRPEPDTTRPDSWAPATDAGSAGEPARSAKTGAGRQDAARKAPQPAAETPVVPESDAGAPAPPGERIAKAMARAGIASRRDAEAMILAGRVSVNGETLTSPARNVTEDDRILVDGEPMPSRERSRLWIFHKPRGVVTTARDPEGRQTVFDVLPEDLPRVVAVGRLDINTEGLLLLTNDGGLAKVIAHPDTGWLRRYRVRAHGDTDQAQLDKLVKGVTIDGMEYGPVEATLDRVQGDNVWLTLGLREGKNREVKRILEHLGLSVNRLIRLSFGPFQLGDLEVGLVEEVRTRVLKDQLGKTLAEQAGVDFDSPVREPIPPFGGPKKSERDAKPAQAPAANRRNAARPAPAPRVSTGGSGPGPRNASWRADDESKPRGTRIPRRGADPRAAQAAAAERGHERVGSIRAGERRIVVERLSATPVEAAPAASRAATRTTRRPSGRNGARPAVPIASPRRAASGVLASGRRGRPDGPPEGAPRHSRTSAAAASPAVGMSEPPTALRPTARRGARADSELRIPPPAASPPSAAGDPGTAAPAESRAALPARGRAESRRAVPVALEAVVSLVAAGGRRAGRDENRWRCVAGPQARHAAQRCDPSDLRPVARVALQRPDACL